jgi:AraC-like DNA-binding protein
MNAGEYSQFIHSVFSGNPPLWLLLRNGIKVLFNLVYILLSLRIVFSSKAGRLSYQRRLWLRSLVIIPLLVLLAFAYVAVAPSATAYLTQGGTTPFIILSMTMAVLIYAISFLLLVTPDIYSSGGKAWNARRERLCSKEESEYLVSLVEKRFSEGAFRNPDLTISDFAVEFKVHPNRLSYAINTYCNASFRDLLNNRRFDYFSARVKEGAHQRQSILEIAFDAGFPSKSTFNRVFKEKTGMSPSEFIKQKETS